MKNIENPKISVIVPIYNAESTLYRCIDSILAQTFTDFELLLVNDGSVDNSGAICDEYEVKDSRIFVLHKENGGVSSARNLGLSHVSGEWVTFIDSDDWVAPCYLKNLMSHISDTIDLVFSYCTIIKETGEVIVENFPPKIIPSKCIETAFIENELHGRTSPWSKLYRMEIVKIDNLRFCERMNIGEDLVFLYSFILKCRNIAFTKDVDYFYNFEVSGSLTKRIHSLECELFGFYKISQTIKELCSINNITNTRALCKLDWILGYYVRRVLNSLYHNKGIHFTKRIEIIKGLDLVPYLTAVNIPAPKEKFLCFLLKHRLLYLYDIIRLIARFFDRV